MKLTTRSAGFRASLILSVFLMPSCAHLVNTLDDVEKGMDREQALEKVNGRPTPYFIRGADAEYVLYRVTTSLLSTYNDSQHDVLFVKFENQKVVDKGVVDIDEERRIRKINPSFELKKWQEAGILPADQIRE